MKPSDILMFYRTKKARAGYYTSVATTLGVVENVATSISSLERFIMLCRKRSVFTDAELAKYWNRNPLSRPFVVNFIHTHSFPKRPNLKMLLEHGVISEAPRGFEQISDDAFASLLNLSNANQSLIVH